MIFCVRGRHSAWRGNMLVIPILGIVMVLGETLEIILTDVRLLARHRYARKQHWNAANRDLDTA